MEFVNMEYLQQIKPIIKEGFNKQKPFRFFYFDNIIYPSAAELLYDNYPTVEDGEWDAKNYIHQNHKFQKTSFPEGSVFHRFFNEVNSVPFILWLEDVTRIKDLQGDPKLFGGGLHQSVTGAFLDVHLDYNYHPETNYRRRLNVLIYLNKGWKEEYEGHIELWDMQKKVQLAKIAPSFNRCVILETNELSFHGHPKPLNTPKGITRKSLASYYFTKEPVGNELTNSHETIYVNTTGVAGEVKIIKSGFRALIERIFK